MIFSIKQIKKANGLLTVAVVFAILNAIESLISIIIAGNKARLIGNFSLTIALVGAIVSIGIAMGNTLGSSLLKNVTLFQIALLDLCSSAIVTIAICQQINTRYIMLKLTDHGHSKFFNSDLTKSNFAEWRENFLQFKT